MSTNKTIQYPYICNNCFQLNPSVAVPREKTLIEEEEEGEEVEGLGQAETYSDYMPAKCKLPDGGWGQGRGR